MIVKILAIGDIVGRKGREMVKYSLPLIFEQYQPDLIIANGENVSGGIGITGSDADDLFAMGIDVITTGNHVWKYHEIKKYFEKNDKLIRPFNYPETSPGRGWVIVEKNGIKYLVINYLGSIFMDGIIPPFYHFDKFFRENKHLFEISDVSILDFHAEATSEKIAFGYYLNGKVNFVYGTHTHVQTADERLLSDKTAYISDIGMTGALNSVIGFETKVILEKFQTLIPQRYKVDEKGEGILSSCLFQWDIERKRAVSVERLNFYN